MEKTFKEMFVFAQKNKLRNVTIDTKPEVLKQRITTYLKKKFKKLEENCEYCKNDIPKLKKCPYCGTEFISIEEMLGKKVNKEKIIKEVEQKRKNKKPKTKTKTKTEKPEKVPGSKFGKTSYKKVKKMTSNTFNEKECLQYILKRLKEEKVELRETLQRIRLLPENKDTKIKYIGQIKKKKGNIIFGFNFRKPDVPYEVDFAGKYNKYTYYAKINKMEKINTFIKEIVKMDKRI